MKKISYLILLSSIAFSCNQTNNEANKQAAQALFRVNQKDESEKLMNLNRQWAKATSPEEFMSYFTIGTLILPPDKGIAKGQEQIGKVFAEYQSFPGFAISWEPQEAFVSASGDLGYTIDRILVNFNDEHGNKIDLFEKGVTIWKKRADGSWKLAVDIWNVDPTINSIYN